MSWRDFWQAFLFGVVIVLCVFGVLYVIDRIQT